MPKRKCEVCRGKGGWVIMVWNRELWRQCQQCGGKGRWWPNNRPKKKGRWPRERGMVNR